MDIEINMINVEDGDAILLMLKDQDRKSLIVIDGGYKRYYPKVRRRLNEILPDFNNQIDLLICTHYDNDHISGVECILDDFHAIIQEIWIHKIDDELSTLSQRFESKIKMLEGVTKIQSLMERMELFKSPKEMRSVLLVEAYRDLLRVVDKIISYGLEEKITEATTGAYFPKFPEFKVVSPSAAYYNSNLEELKGESIAADLELRLSNSSKNLLSLQEYFIQAMDDNNLFINPCERLETSSLRNGVTATNMVSIVTMLEANGKKYLFTGDAGIESFTDHTPNWEDDLKDLYFLDVPHHGSKNNLSQRQVEVFNPEIAFVSGKNGPNRPSTFIKSCVQSKEGNRIFEVTNADPNTWYLKVSSEGDVSRVLLD